MGRLDLLELGQEYCIVFAAFVKGLGRARSNVRWTRGLKRRACARPSWRRTYLQLQKVAPLADIRLVVAAFCHRVPSAQPGLQTLAPVGIHTLSPHLRCRPCGEGLAACLTVSVSTDFISQTGTLGVFVLKVFSSWGDALEGACCRGGRRRTAREKASCTCSEQRCRAVQRADCRSGRFSRDCRA